MWKYIISNIKRNKVKFLIYFILLFVSTTFLVFTFEIICNLNYVKDTTTTLTKAHTSDMREVSTLLQVAAAILIGFCYLLVNNTYSVVIQGREQEFNMLYNIGLDKSGIRRMLYMEITISVLVTILFSSIIGTAGSYIFLKQFQLFTGVKVYVEIYLAIAIGALAMMFHIVNLNLKKISIGKNADRKRMFHHFTYKQIRKKTVSMVICIFIVIYCLYDPNKIFDYYFGEFGFAFRSSLYWICILIAIDGIIYYVFRILEIVSKKMKVLSLYLAVEQNIYRCKRIISIISSLIISVVLLVGLQGFYNSIRKSVVNVVDETVKYNYLVTYENVPKIDEDALRLKLDKTISEDREYSIALTVKFIINDEKIYITGIERNYLDMQILYLYKERDISDIFNSKNILKVIFPNKMANDKRWKVNDRLDLHYSEGEEKTMPITIAELYKPIDLRQAFTDRKLLSKKIYNDEGKYNSIYFMNYSEEDILNIMNELDNGKYYLSDITDIENKSKKQAVNGTELIEAYIYIFLFFTASLIVNIFILSFHDRKNEYRKLMIAGFSKRILLGSMILESVIIFIFGTGVGWICGESFVDGALIIMSKELVFETVKYMPYMRLIQVISLCFAGLMACIIYVGLKIINNKDFDSNNGG